MSDHYDDFDASPNVPDDHGAHPRDDRLAVASIGSAPPLPSCKPFDLPRFAEWLPRLGAVLWLDRRDGHRAPSRATIGARGVLLLDHPALGLLGHCVAATAHTQVTAQGPREWLAFRDAEGSTQAKLYLLPDTDYLAWDEMAAACDLAPSTAAEPPGWHAHTAFLRHALARIGTHWRARLLTFEHRALPWQHLLGAKPPLRISLLGLELARVIARCEGAELVSPLHSAV
jgi:hypothetical protein